MPISQYFHPFFLDDTGDAERFIHAIGEFTALGRKLISTSDLSSNAVLDELPAKLHAASGIRFQGLDFTIAYCKDEHPPDAKKLLLGTLDLGRWLIEDWITAQTKTLYTWLTGEIAHLDFRLCFVWQPAYTAVSPTNELFWRRHVISQGWPAVYPDLDKIKPLFEEKPDLELNIRRFNRAVADDELLPGERDAIRGLRTILAAKEARLSFGGISPIFHACVTGPSGSGKTHVVRAFARSEGLDLFELSLASWMPQGSRTSQCTVRKIAEHVRRSDRPVIYLDELDKLRPRAQTCEYTRYLLDEVMSVLDGRLESLEGWTAALAEKFRDKGLIVASGAWQAAYEQAFVPHRLLGGTWDSVSIADTFMEENWLPTELLARLSTMLVEVRPPSLPALVDWVARIHEDAGAPIAPNVIANAASEIYEARTGMRALEAYVVRLFSLQRETNGDGPEKGGVL